MYISLSTRQQSSRLALLATSLGFVLICLDVTVVNVALARIRASLAIGSTELEWVVNAYTLAFASLLLTAGSLADRFGARLIFVCGFAVFTGARLTNISGTENRALVGFSYRLPYLIMLTANVGSTGDFRLNIGKTFQITPRFSINARAQYDTQQAWELAFGADYMLTKRLSLSTAYHTDYGFGAGLGFRF